VTYQTHREKEKAAAAGACRVSFDLSPAEGTKLREVQAAYGDVEASLSQVAKMLLKRGMDEWRRERK
jgi:hypothetical protein